MPPTHVVFYRDDDGAAPCLEWFGDLPGKAQDKCRVRLERLQALGHELRRPEADYLRDGIYELRVRLGTVNYRMLYFFHGRIVAVVAHGLVKEREVPARKSTWPLTARGSTSVTRPSTAYEEEPS